jgi:hypothetical protein
MLSFSDVAAVREVQPFNFSDAQRKPRTCDLLVNPAQGWAIATESADAEGAGLMQSFAPLAAKICQEYQIEPAQLTLFVRYAYDNAFTSLYVVHFAHGERDLFEGVRFLTPRRQELPFEAAAELLEQLQSGQAPSPTLRAIPQP